MNLLSDIVNFAFLFIGMYFTVLMIMLFKFNENKIFRRPPNSKFPSVSIIIPAHNEENTIKGTIDAALGMSYPRKKEIIVVDDGSTDGTFKIIKGMSGVKIIRKKQGGKASALNVGLKSASGEIVVCIDSDSYPEKDALLKAVPFFEDGVASVTTSVLVKKTNCLLEKLQEIEYALIAWTRKMFEFIDAIYVTPGAMSLYKSDVLRKVGGFDEKNMAEDIEIAWRLMKNKYKIRMALDAKVYTDVPNTLAKWWRQRIRWNIGGMQTTFKYIGCFRKSEFGSIGTFLLPMFSISYALSVAGILLVSYMIYSVVRFILGALLFGFNPISSFFSYLSIDVFLVFMAIGVALTLMLLRLNMRTIKSYTDMPIRIKYVVLYLTVYICMFPINLIHGSIKFILKKYEW